MRTTWLCLTFFLDFDRINVDELCKIREKFIFPSVLF